MSMFCQRMDKSESGGGGCKIPSNVLTKILSQTAAATLRISIDEEPCQLAYERFLEGIAQALKRPSTVSTTHAVAHVS